MLNWVKIRSRQSPNILHLLGAPHQGHLVKCHQEENITFQGCVVLRKETWGATQISIYHLIPNTLLETIALTWMYNSTSLDWPPCRLVAILRWPLFICLRELMIVLWHPQRRNHFLLFLKWRQRFFLCVCSCLFLSQHNIIVPFGTDITLGWGKIKG